MTMSEVLLPEFDQETAGTRKVLAAVPDDKLTWKPHEKSMTLGRLAGHVAEMGSWISNSINMDKLEIPADWKPANPSSSAEILAIFDKNAAEARTALEGLKDEAMGVPWSLAFGGQTMFTMPRGAVLRSVCLNHMIHHRAQLTVYLRLLDIPVPGLYGPSADDKQ